jgi:phosphonate C-P lyase system protein PhnG
MSNSTDKQDFTGGDDPGDRGAACASVHAGQGAGGAAACPLVRLAGRRSCPAHDILRPPEIGTVMVRGRAGAKGAPFNLGEMTVTRATVRLADGAVGHGHVQGRDKDAALAAALIDALCEAGEDARWRLRSSHHCAWRRRHSAGPARPGRRRRRSSFSPWCGEKADERAGTSKAVSRTRPVRPPTRFAVRLQALSRPGRIETLAGATPPGPCSAAPAR